MKRSQERSDTLTNYAFATMAADNVNMRDRRTILPTIARAIHKLVEACRTTTTALNVPTDIDAIEASR